jgi:hypothetical protein
MSRSANNVLAAVAAVVLAVTSIGSIVSVPPAQALTSVAMASVPELA